MGLYPPSWPATWQIFMLGVCMPARHPGCFPSGSLCSSLNQTLIEHWNKDLMQCWYMRCRPFQRHGSQDIGANVSTLLILNYMVEEVLPSPSCLHILVTENVFYTIIASRWSFPFVKPYQGSHIRHINYGAEERKGCCWQLHGLELCQSSETRKKTCVFSHIFKLSAFDLV